MALPWLLALATIGSGVVAYAALPWALLWAFLSISAAMFLGSVTAVALIGMGIFAALLFGVITIGWIICVGRSSLSKWTESRKQAPSMSSGPASARASSHDTRDESDCTHSTSSFNHHSSSTLTEDRSETSVWEHSQAHCHDFAYEEAPAEGDTFIQDLEQSDLDNIVANPAEDAESAHLANNGYLDSDAMDSAAPIAVVGRGRYGVVELVRLRLPDGRHELLARKTLRQRDIVADTLFRDEVLALQVANDCPYVLRYRGSRELPDRLELFTEYASGGSVEQEVADGMRQVPWQDRCAPLPLMPLRRLRAVAASALLALEPLHAEGIAHLAVSPRRLLLTESGRVQLGGLSHAASVAASGPLPRPPVPDAYTPPELRPRGAAPLPVVDDGCDGVLWPPAAPPPVEEAVSTKADIYSVGALVAMCALWHCHPGAMLAYQEGRAELPDWVPEELADFVRLLMAADPEARPSAAEALAHPFLAGVDEADVML